jgi:hypothetical protein
VILSVLDPRKCEYLKDYSLDFEHAYMTAWYLEIFNEFVDQLDDDELLNGYFQQDGATCHMRAWPKSKAFLMTGLF